MNWILQEVYWGYRQIAEMISLIYEVNISKENARLALLHVDPDGVRNRRRNKTKGIRIEWSRRHTILMATTNLKNGGYAYMGE